jgi:hypothetical protein
MGVKLTIEERRRSRERLRRRKRRRRRSRDVRSSTCITKMNVCGNNGVREPPITQ